MKTETQKKPRTKLTAKQKQKRNATVVGAGVLVLAIVGVITVISLVVSLFASIFDNSDKKAEFEKFISPVVMVDPVAFSSVNNADEHSILMASMWNLLLNVGENAAYPEDEYGMLLVPEGDLAVSAASLFGSEFTPSHQTFGNTSMTFEYNEETSTYTVPPQGFTIQYQPRVDKIKRKGKMYTLTVSYVNTNTTTITKTESGSEQTDNVDKVMYYNLEKIGKNKYVIRSVADNEKGEFNKTTSQGAVSETNSGLISKTESEISKKETSSK